MIGGRCAVFTKKGLIDDPVVASCRLCRADAQVNDSLRLMEIPGPAFDQPVKARGMERKVAGLARAWPGSPNRRTICSSQRPVPHHFDIVPPASGFYSPAMPAPDRAVKVSDRSAIRPRSGPAAASGTGVTHWQIEDWPDSPGECRSGTTLLWRGLIDRKATL
ncbi:MAG: hypothetical protein JWM59_3651 [Verrucomicrobiales bacterium]|nr:hypothetical protein [Verrucomicrobiales bacterium]